MLLGTMKQLTYTIGDIVILNELSAHIPNGACIAIVGPNGAGKTTLLSLLAGELIPTSGSIDWNGKKPNISYVKQETSEEMTDWEQRGVAAYRSKWHVPKEAKYSFASGGERMKMRLASALSENSELVLLDEPTNHLDRESLDELVTIVNERKVTYMIVSHDRYFIDQTADVVFEVEHGCLTVYEGNYSSYRKEKEMKRDIQASHYAQQQRKIAQVEEHIKQLEHWSRKAHAKKDADKVYSRMKAKKKNIQIRSKRTRLEAEISKERIKKPEEEVQVKFDVKGKRKKGQRVLEVKDLGKSFSDKELFSNVSFTIQTGERIALIGSNGSGKSTLFKMMMGEEHYDGELWLTESMTIGYMSQTVLDLPNDLLVADYFQSETFAEQGLIRIQLANLGLEEEQWDLLIGELSQGERVKLKLMQFILEGTDVLLLDEPTNHLDLPSREEMEKALATFPGTLIFASHDTYFTERMANSLLIFEDQSIRKLQMTWKEWEERNIEPEQSTSSKEEEKLRLETELQAVLGKLSMLKIGDPDYDELDQEFTRLRNDLNHLT